MQVCVPFPSGWVLPGQHTHTHPSDRFILLDNYETHNNKKTIIKRPKTEITGISFHIGFEWLRSHSSSPCRACVSNYQIYDPYPLKNIGLAKQRLLKTTEKSPILCFVFWHIRYLEPFAWYSKFDDENWDFIIFSEPMAVLWNLLEAAKWSEWAFMFLDNLNYMRKMRCLFLEMVEMSFSGRMTKSFGIRSIRICFVCRECVLIPCNYSQTSKEIKSANSERKCIRKTNSNE